jgi:sulfatase maturation enzyme AslB (radical SAM superfamily)
MASKSFLGSILNSFSPIFKSPHKKNDSSFCIKVFKNMFILNDGTVKPCCLFKTEIKKDGRVMSINEDKANDIFNSTQMRDIRKKMINGDVVQDCEFCFAQESKGLWSFRQHYNDGWLKGWQNPNGETFQNLQLDTIKNNFYIEPKTIEITLGSTCNLKCRSCYSDSSSAIESDSIHSSWAPPQSSPFAGSIIRTEKKQSKKIDKITVLKEILNNPKDFDSILLTGGETLALKETKAIMSHLVKTGAAEHTPLFLVTNATLITQEWCDLAAQFKQLLIMVSIDGVGDINEYIRYPAVWSDIEAGLEKLKGLSNARLILNPTIQAYNMLSVSEISRYCEDVGIELNSAFPLEDPNYLSSYSMPLAVRYEAAKRLIDYASSSNVAWKDHLLKIANSWINAPENDPKLIEEFMLFTNDLDFSRHQDFSTTFPELKCMIEASGFKWSKQRRFS